MRVMLENEHDNSRIMKWKNVDVNELYVSLGLVFHMGHTRLNRINDYWSTDALFDLPLRKFMSRDRFLLLLRNFSFMDPNVTFDNSDPNRFTKPIITFLNNLMKYLVIPPN
jgi:hypothetical protein